MYAYCVPNMFLVASIMRKAQELSIWLIYNDISGKQDRCQSRIFVIGNNIDGNLGLDHITPIHKLTEIKSGIDITTIYSSDGYTIYSDDDYKNIWSVGRNDNGQCGRHGYNSKLPQKITFSEENHINIKKICVSPVGGSTFFITIDNKVYGIQKDGKEKINLNQY